MDDVKVIRLSYLLRRLCPISGAFSLHTCHSPSTPPSISGDPKTLNPSSKSSTKILKSLSQPSIITGTLSLPNSLSSNSSSGHSSCFAFSDNSCSVCCDVLNFDFRMIGTKIHVLAWNFIPFKDSGGFLEIINWKFVESSIISVNSFPLVLDDVGKDSDKARYCICGVLDSVSPISSSMEGNLSGFMVEMLCCDCTLCKSKSCVNNSDHLVVQGNERHKFSRTEFVYLSGTALSWHPAILKLVRNVIAISGLRKKLVYLGESEAEVMLVSTKMTCLHYSNSENIGSLLGNGRSGFEGKGELGMYVGVVKGIYNQGMVVELDEEVWLLLTDQLLVLPHSLRVGAVLCARNVHIVKPQFPWRKMLILGACYKTNISTVSFSPLETRCQLLSHSQSLLQKFIESLVFPARLWVILVIQCFRRKFSGVFPGKEILGSINKKGLVEAYARSILPSSAFCLRHSMFVEFCKHGSCGSGSNVSYGSLRLAVPFSHIVNNCGRMWIRSFLQMKYTLDIMEDCSQLNNLFQEKRLSDKPARRIFQSKDIGISLFGNIKISPATGRLQYVDATGSIDAVIPDLPSAWNMNAIYEVMDYSLVLEGRPEMKSQSWILDDDLFSCSGVFRSVTSDRQTELVVYVHFAWSNVICRDFLVLDDPGLKDSTAELDHGTFHLLRLAHKFPVQSQFHSDSLISVKCFSFAEAIILPCDLIIGPSNVAALPTSISEHELGQSSRRGFAFKRCKTGHASRCIEKVGVSNTLSQYGNRSCGHSSSVLSLPRKRSADNFNETSPVQCPCTVTVRRIYGQSVAVTGLLYFSQGSVNHDSQQLISPRTVLLEFNSENLFKYKLLHIGGYYIMKHCAEKCFCESNDRNSGSKIVVNFSTCLWSLSFQFNEVLSNSGLCHHQSFDFCSICESSYKPYLQNELLFHPCGVVDHVSFYDVSLHVTPDAISLLDLDVQALIMPMLKPYVRLSDLFYIGQPVDSRNTVASFLHSQGTYTGSCLPQGNLISVVGTVVTLHSGRSSADSVSCNGAAGDIHLMRFTHGRKHVICLDVLTDGHMVRIDGCLSEHNYPVGLGPGADVTFHRVLALGGQKLLILIPVSFVTVNSVREVPSPVVFPFRSMPEETVASCLISGLIQCDACKPRRFRSRVVAIHIVILERNRDLDKLLFDVRPRRPIASIPLAGFVLDDGSSQCCCWANGERAATFLRLHEEMPQIGFGSSWLRLDRTGIGKACSTPSSYLDKILKKHGRVTLKNCGSLYETLGQDLQLSVGSDIIGSQDEDLLKFMIFNACSSTYWSVVGHVMDSGAMNELEKYVPNEQMTMHALKNVWALEVRQVNTVAEARALYQETSDQDGGVLVQ